MEIDLAEELSLYSFRERIKIYRVARLLRKLNKLDKKTLSREEELEESLKELEED